MLLALASGLGEEARFDVSAVGLTDGAAAQAAETADAAAIFYGAPAAPIARIVQALAAKMRHRGARVVAVLQREQAAQRDECFRSGASDVIFMPMPKDAFVARLASSVALELAEEAGAPAQVAVATRGASSRVDLATVCSAGVVAPGALPLNPGDSVRLSWAGFQAWGLVVRGSPAARIRFAGLSPDEETKIQAFVRTAPQQPDPAAAAATRAAPVSGPPPGFAERKAGRAPPQAPAQPQARPPQRPSPPAAARAPAQGASIAATLFDAENAPPPPRPPKPVKQGPPWPRPVAAGTCK